LENHTQFREEFDKCFECLLKLIDHSFATMNKNPETKEDMVNLWKSHILKFISYTFKSSEKYNNKDVFKAITKALIFGK